MEISICRFCCVSEDVAVSSFKESVEQYDQAIERVGAIDTKWYSYMSYRNAPVYNNDVLPEYAAEDRIMSFFEKILD